MVCIGPKLSGWVLVLDDVKANILKEPEPDVFAAKILEHPRPLRPGACRRAVPPDHGQALHQLVRPLEVAPPRVVNSADGSYLFWRWRPADEAVRGRRHRLHRLSTNFSLDPPGPPVVHQFSLGS